MLQPIITPPMYLGGCGFSQTLQANAELAHYSKPQLLPSTSFPLHHPQ